MGGLQADGRPARPRFASSRLATIRRLYFYLVALVSFIAGLAGLDNLFSHLSDAWLGQTGLSAINSDSYLRDNIASSASVLLVATPIFLLHWGFMQRRQGETGERRAAIWPACGGRRGAQ